MYTNPSNIIKTIIQLLDRNKDPINAIVQDYEGEGRVLTVFEGMRKTLPRDAFPSLEFEPTTAANTWYSTRAQRPTYSFTGTLTVVNDNEDYGVEYPATVMTIISEIMTAPQNLQLLIQGEQKTDPDLGLINTYMQDALIDNVTFNANKNGTIRTVEFNYFVTVHEPFYDSQFGFGTLAQPTLIRKTIQVP